MTWIERDEPVLRAIIELSDEGAHLIRPEQLTERTGLDPDTVQLALRAIVDDDPPLVTGATDSRDWGGGRQISVVHSPTGRARRLIGTWPTPEKLAEQIIAELDRAAELEDRDDERGRLKRMAAWMDGAGRDIFLNVVATAVAKGMGM